MNLTVIRSCILGFSMTCLCGRGETNSCQCGKESGPTAVWREKHVLGTLAAHSEAADSSGAAAKP